jgi:transcriptional repressor NrdR
MKCPFCGHPEDKVLDSRPTDEGSAIRRRRECASCGKRFTTYEKVEGLPLVVIKKDQSRQPFDSEKLLSRLLRACVKRPIPIKQLEALVDEIENAILSDMKREITSQQIGDMVLERLKEIDEVAYVRFASVYRAFDSVDSFLEELEEIKSKK